jgi:hypothetical protein
MTKRKRASPEDHGTPETRRKVRAVVVAEYAHRGWLKPHHEVAATELRMVWHALQRGLFSGCAGFEPSIGGSGFVDPIDRMTEYERGCWERHFGPWMTWAGRRKVGATSLADVVMAVVVDNERVRDLEERLRLGHGRLMKALRHGLDRYAEIAGMATRRAA